MPSANDVRAGQALELDGGLYQIVDHNHTKPGKGKAFVKMKLKNLDGGGVIERTFRPDETVSRAVIDRREHQFLYRDDVGYHFMDNETYEQTMLNTKQLGDGVNYMVDGLEIKLETYEGEPIAIALRSNGQMIHRYTARRNEPRGMFCAIGRCTDCIMVVNGRPNIRTCVEPLKEGMIVETQSGKGSVK